jgi:hypothetical protein
VGAKAGTGVGVSVGAMFLVALTVILTRQYLSHSRKKEAAAYNSAAGQWPHKIRSIYPEELHGDSSTKVSTRQDRPYELPSE